MKKIFLNIVLIITTTLFIGCSTKSEYSLDKPVAKQEGFINYFEKPYYEVFTEQDVEDVAIYLPKDTTTVRLKMKVSNLEDVIYMKLITDDGYEIDKILRRVENMKDLGYEQDGYMYEPSIEKNVVTLQVYVPSIYLYNGVYKPKLIFSFKRNSRSVQEKVKLAFVKHVYSVSNKNAQENPLYSTLSEYCKASNKVSDDFFNQIVKVNENRIYLETIKDIENSCK
ncbi:MAG: hypothetical protein OQK11_08810 [Thiovulaceae bacterium]|nr:hypothetical protein [Sulfurimonadaceae bacterium]